MRLLGHQPTWETNLLLKSIELESMIDALPARHAADVATLRPKLRKLQRDLHVRHDRELHWTQLHDLELRIERLRSLPQVVHDAERHIASDLTRAEARKRVQELHRTRRNLRRERAEDFIREAHYREGGVHQNERNTARDWLIAGTGAALTAGLLVVMAKVAFKDTALLVTPDDSGMAPWKLLALVLGLGAMGGILHVLAAFYDSGRVGGTVKFQETRYFDPRLSFMVVAVSLGAWTGYIANLLASAAVPDSVVTVPILCLLAVGGGFAPIVITRRLKSWIAGRTRQP